MRKASTVMKTAVHARLSSPSPRSYTCRPITAPGSYDQIQKPEQACSPGNRQAKSCCHNCRWPQIRKPCLYWRFGHGNLPSTCGCRLNFVRSSDESGHIHSCASYAAARDVPRNVVNVLRSIASCWFQASTLSCANSFGAAGCRLAGKVRGPAAVNSRRTASIRTSRSRTRARLA